MTVSVLAANDYEATEYDAVLVREESVVCLDAEEDTARVIPLANVTHVDGDPGDAQPGHEIARDFFGGAEYAFLDFEQFPSARPE